MFSKDRVNLRGNKSKWYLIGTTILGLGMVYFLTTNVFIEEELEVFASPIGEEISTSGQQDIEILEWLYDENEATMQVILDRNDMRFEVNQLDIQAVQRSTMRPVDATILYELEAYLVVEINQVEPNFEQISLQLYDLVTSEEGEEKRSGIVNLYTDYREVERKKIEEKDESQLFVYLMDTLIEGAENQINDHRKVIQDTNELIVEVEEDIQLLEDERQYQTEEERVRTNNQVNALEVKKDDQRSRQQELEERIKIEQERIHHYENRKRHARISLVE